MNIGDKVRFLFETGGGIVKGFKDKNTVVVEGDDGFEIPMLVTDCVVVGNTDAMNFERPSLNPTASKPVPATTPKNNTQPAAASVQSAPTTMVEEAPKPIIVQEFAGHDRLNVHLAFLPVDIKAISTSLMEAWLVNDSNYFISYVWASIGSGSVTLFGQGQLEPNSVVFLREFTRDQYQELEHVSFQLLAYKQDKPYLRKPAIDVELRVDTVKFFKLHTFVDTPFFDEPALLCDIVRDDRPVRPVAIPRDELHDALNGKKSDDSHPSGTGKRSRFAFPTSASAPLEVDLHIEELLETTAGMNNADILEYQLETFRRVLRENQTHRGMRIVFIHGKGDGVLRNALKKELDRKTDHYSYQDASFQRYGFGAMLVIVK